MKSIDRQTIAKVLTIAALLVPTLAQAHPGHSHGSGVAEGMAHPLAGWDHLAAMLAVGIWAALLGGRALWALPAAFVGAMAIGAGIGLGGYTLPGAEQAILASVVVLVILAITSARLPILAGMLIVGGFAIFHGYAHAAEMPAGASVAQYAIGFLASTALLHAAGIGCGRAIGSRPGQRVCAEARE